jgi:hypothetical protein
MRDRDRLGMTDTYARKLFRRLNGIELPGAAL